MGNELLNVTALRNVCRALRESPDPEAFTMCSYAHECGTPACCLGHYALRHDLQNVFKLSAMRRLKLVDWTKGGKDIEFDDEPVLEHFGINTKESFELFSGTGCNYAGTPEAAAQFIENFIKEKQRVPTVDSPEENNSGKS